MTQTRERTIPTKADADRYYSVRIAENRHKFILKIYVLCKKKDSTVLRTTCRDVLVYDCTSMNDAIEKATTILTHITEYNSQIGIRRQLVGKHEIRQNY